MMTVIKNSIDLEGKWFTFCIDGVEIKLKIRPLVWEVGMVIESRHKEIKSLKMRGSKIIKKTTTNFKTFSNDLVDYCLEDFQGIGSAPNKHFEITVENKIKVLAIKGITDFIMEKAKELARERAEEVLSWNE